MKFMLNLFILFKCKIKKGFAYMYYVQIHKYFFTNVLTNDGVFGKLLCNRIEVEMKALQYCAKCKL